MVKNYRNNGSVLLFKVHHFLTDGVGAVLLGAALQGSPTKKQLPALRKQDKWDYIKKCAMVLASPYYLAKDAIALIKVNNENIYHFDKVHEDFNFASSSEFALDQIRTLSKAHKCSINDLL